MRTTCQSQRIALMKASVLLLCLSLPAIVASAASPITPPAAAVPVLPSQTTAFMKQYCFNCHGEKKKMGGLRLDNVELEISGRTGNASVWQEVMDKLNLGEMPPSDEKGIPLPDAKSATAVAATIAQTLRDFDRSAHATGGRGVLRRLNRDEYANTVADLLALDRLTLASLVADLPGEGMVEGFNNIGSGLMVDVSLMEEYLRVAPQIAKLAVVSGTPPTPTRKERYELKNHPAPKEDLELSHTKPVTITPEFIAEQLKVGNIGHYPRGGNVPRFVPNNNGTVTLLYAAKSAGSGPRGLNMPGTSVIAVEGDYIVRLRAGAFPGEGEWKRPVKVTLEQGKRNLAGIDVSFDITASENAPQVYEERVHLKPLPREGKEKANDSLGFIWNGVPVVKSTPEWDRLYSITHSKTNTAEERRAAHIETIKLNQPNRIYDPTIDLKKTPRLVVDWFEIEGPIQEEWPPKSWKTVFFKGEPKGKDTAYLKDIFTRLCSRAYRRPVYPEDVEPPVKLATAALTKGASFEDAVKRGIESILCSPNFIFLRETSADATAAAPGNARLPVSDFELAARLSYFLWSTMPDDELLRLANEGKLRQPAVRIAQVERMLKDARSAEFVQNFTRQWLTLGNVGAIQPDNRIYKEYHDQKIEKWSVKETYAFFDHMLRQNLSIMNFLDSDFAMLNEPMAKFYGIAGVSGDAFRPVKLTPGSQRGGVVSQSAILVQGSDGVRTKPVSRGKWILVSLLNDPPNPPPANAGEVQPNSAGAKLTVRERLDKHRTVATCASCHTKIDPFGFGLENYNAVGAWRDRQDGENFGKNGPPIDASGKLDKIAFKDAVTFRRALVQQKDKFAKGFTEKMLTYALGRTLEHSDRETVLQITAALGKEDYKLANLVQRIAGSELFLTK